ncbi:hypothetical protein CKO15_07865 [Halorhodospira abdelmalekii]|uniref:alpha/beta hydrolase n=1 Tax=Halorhodospira abdelmalekii TaxID=421629 RepID=UPI00190469F0|nr:alpha/beta fold hydrolase [Halorhodospira abdelmalekii]MBK1735201.1 hypothetical protein [Halorhodospira abdelmalekii]
MSDGAGWLNVLRTTSSGGGSAGGPTGGDGYAAWWRRGSTVAALLLLLLALAQLLADRSGVERWQTVVDETPVSVYTPQELAEPAPTILIAHGFAGSRQMMERFALTFAQNGYVAVTFDYLGHGRHPQPLFGELREWDGAAAELMAQTATVKAFARDLPQSDGRVAVLGHSLGAGLMARFAQLYEGVDATVSISFVSPKTTPETPLNLLTIVGGWEPRFLEQGREIVAMAAEVPAEAIEIGQTYGEFAAGSARRLDVIARVEHVGILFSARTADAARAWFDEAFERDGERDGDSASSWLVVNGGWLALLFASLLLLARRLIAILPVVSSTPRGAGAGWPRLLLVAGLPALATPLLLAPLPTDFLPVVVGDYLALHFALYGTLMLIALWWSGGRPAPRQWWSTVDLAPGRMVAATLLLLLVSLVGLGWALEQFVLSFYPVAERLPLLAVILLGTLPFFLADEWLTRGQGARRGAYPLTKLLFLISLGIAVALDYESLSFLPMILPVTVIFFILYGLFSRWSYRRTGCPLVAGLVNAVAFAWALAVTFPLYSGLTPP